MPRGATIAAPESVEAWCWPPAVMGVGLPGRARLGFAYAPRPPPTNPASARPRGEADARISLPRRRRRRHATSIQRILPPLNEIPFGTTPAIHSSP
ncbi:hypothetical protein E2C01_029812 [Portunus trituberculatus]|uniref:Uncharacterized protein n=1 Tax=Portunus trituberculatus TaxID=210409 RepID=A0A5B7ET82_PORTR|nr:hypothetical protein [Portunus trituberculatus]